MKKLLASASVAALLVSAPALAQSTDKNAAPTKAPTETTAPQMKSDPNSTMKAMPSGDRAQKPDTMNKDGDKSAQKPDTMNKDGDKAVNRAQSPAMKDGDKTPATTAAAPAAPKAEALGMHVRASNLIGARVYSAKNENIGDINDLIIGPDGKVTEVIIGVGGFLGIGERNVAVKVSDLKFGSDKNNALRVSGDFTKDSLKKMPAWDKKKWDKENTRS